MPTDTMKTMRNGTAGHCRRAMTIALFAMAMGAMAENTVTVTKFHQSYPYTGKATVEYTVGGTLPTNSVAEITINTDDASATFVQSNIVAGANSHVIDFASSFGGVLLLTNASFVVTISEGAAPQLGGVQLWENGPYWAECNVGASVPEQFGYYFWWGDTVGYKRRRGSLTDLENGRWSAVVWASCITGQEMDSSPFTASSCPTYDKDDLVLRSEGYIDSTGNLVAAHDAATAHLGAPWRMPTYAEFSALISNCDWTWTTTNGVNGYEVRGRGDYAANRIFLPAAGCGGGEAMIYCGLSGYYWSSTLRLDSYYGTWCLEFLSGSVDWTETVRYGGMSIRPVRGFAQ